MSDSIPTTIQPIHAYFSHSYRPEDREVNLAFWELFSKEGFFFTVDPVINNPQEKRPFIVPHVERLMRFSDCFISVVTHRITEAETTYSQYIAFENFLAELAEKPRLVFVEDDLEVGVFGTSDYVIPFNRNLLDKKVNKYNEHIRNFANQVRNYISYKEQTTDLRHTKKAGILLKETQSYTRETIKSVQKCLKDNGFTSEDLQPLTDIGLKEFIRKVSELELIVIDVLDPSITVDTLAVIQTKAIPCIRIARLESSSTIDALKSHGLLKDYFIGADEPLIKWESSDLLISEIKKYLKRFREERDIFDTYNKGRKYFISAGRDKHKVFISNPDSLNPLALELANELESLNIQHFQYKSDESGIEIGTKDWENELDKELAEFNIFVALINDDYHQSKYCQKEIKVAIDRFKYEDVTILAYLCRKTHFPNIILTNSIQGKDISIHSKDKEKVKIITKQIDKELLKKKDETKKKEINVKEKISVFLNHASEDKPLVKKLYDDLKKVSWLDPWLDEEKLLPGSDWAYEIDQAIKNADAVIICISEISSSKIGVVQEEIRKAEEMQRRRPHGYIYMIPVLLEKCKVPDNLDQYHWVDITESGKIDLIIKSLERLRTLK